MVVADLPAVTITTAPAAVQTALVSYISDYDHHTLGINVTVGGIISAIYMASAANPTAANAILDVRSHLNFMELPVTKI
ncbi:hypothetical protein LTS08_004576 [Lithohypha guttulata]|nr:hypothetical protein LTS08_004576 [Lithohypha guttulata]